MADPAMTDGKDTTSTRPYLIRALHEWCCDNGLTPYVAVRVDERVQVPREFVKNGEIVLNVSFDATSSLTLGNEFIEFRARFGGVARDVVIPVTRVMAIYARENGQGMAFPLEAGTGGGEQPHEASLLPLEGGEAPSAPSSAGEPGAEGEPPPQPTRPAGGAGRPALKRVK